GSPVALSAVWFSIYGMPSINIEWTEPGSLIGPVVQEGDTAAALFTFLEHFPAPEFMMGFSVLIVIIFFTTSADSASLVVDMLTSGNTTKPPVRQRIICAALGGTVAATQNPPTRQEE